jgi:hypothetical protein
VHSNSITTAENFGSTTNCLTARNSLILSTKETLSGFAPFCALHYDMNMLQSLLSPHNVIDIVRNLKLHTILLLLLLLLLISTANGVLPGESDTSIRHNTQITHITQNNTSLKQNTINDTVHTIKTMQIQVINTTINTTIINKMYAT